MIPHLTRNAIHSQGPLAARRLKLFFEARDVKKEYVALVDGEFPPGRIKCDDAFSGHFINSSGSIKELSLIHI